MESMPPLLQVCDYFVDEEAIDECCKALGARIFEGQPADDVARIIDVQPGGSAQTEVCKVRLYRAQNPPLPCVLYTMQ